MTKWERQCYDWGWEDAEERIIKLVEKHYIENDEGGTGYCQGCDWKNAYAVGFDKHLTELIRKSTQPFLTVAQVEQMVDEMLEG